MQVVELGVVLCKKKTHYNFTSKIKNPFLGPNSAWPGHSDRLSLCLVDTGRITTQVRAFFELVP